MQIGKVIHDWRMQNGYSLRIAGKKMGVDPATLHRAESGNMPSAETLAKILMWLIGENENG